MTTERRAFGGRRQLLLLARKRRLENLTRLEVWGRVGSRRREESLVRRWRLAVVVLHPAFLGYHGSALLGRTAGWGTHRRSRRIGVGSRIFSRRICRVENSEARRRSRFRRESSMAW